MFKPYLWFNSAFLSANVLFTNKVNFVYLTVMLEAIVQQGF
jgi:hypothetical protein